MSDGTGHPSRFGYAQCEACGHHRPAASIKNGSCSDWGWCIDRHVEALLRQTYDAIHRESVQGWDANGAPTGIDENGDAA